MTNDEIIKMWRMCQKTRCIECKESIDIGHCMADQITIDDLVDRLEALIAENEHLREVAKMIGKDNDVPTKWVSVEERLPEESGLYLTIATESPVRWLHGFESNVGKFGAWWDYEPDGTKHEHYRFIESENITHWMPFPGTEESPHRAERIEYG